MANSTKCRTAQSETSNIADSKTEDLTAKTNTTEVSRSKGA